MAANRKAPRRQVPGKDRDPKTGRFLPGNAGGPRTPEGRTRALANLPNPETAGLQHGVQGRAGLLYPCDKCVCADCPEKLAGARCKIEAQYIAARRQELHQVPHITPADWPAVDLLIWQEVRIDRARRFLAQAGEFLPGADKGYVEWQPVAQGLPALMNSYNRMLQALGLTPGERKKLEEKGDAGAGASIAAALREIAAQERTRGAIEGDFEAQDDETGATAEGA